MEMLQQLDPPGLHAHRHDLRVGAERLEERAALRRSRATPRSSTARSGTKKRRPRRRRPSSTEAPSWWSSTSRKPPSSATSSDTGATPRRFSPGSSTRSPRASTPSAHLSRVGLANQTTMLMSESLEVQNMLRAAMVGPVRRSRALDDTSSGLRHDLQRHAGSPGRGRRASAGRAGRPDARDRRLQQQQHLQPGPDLRPIAADIPRRRPGLPAVARRDPAPARGPEGRGHDARAGCPCPGPCRSA